MNHPLIINLHYSFQDYDNLYFVLDLLTGGDLRYQLGRHPRRFYNESQTKFFIACIVESLIYIHSKNIIHRDIKPENLIFDDKGYLHITDFGIAKYSDNKNLNETSGTPGYMAPEVMRGLNHTGSVDYFAVGIITYELMLGKRPYVGKNRKEIKEQMMLKQVYLDDDNIPLGWSQESADFINRLLVRKDTNRLGYYNDYEIKRHPWLHDINFDDLLAGKIRAPFVPRKNYENYDKKYCQEEEVIGIETNMRYDDYKNNEKYSLLFEGFTYYNVDESQILSFHEIYRKPSVKYIKSNSSVNINNTNYVIYKSKTINLDYDYKRRINQYIPNDRSSPANNISMRTIQYSNGNEVTINRIDNSNLRRNQSSRLLNNSKYSFKNPNNIYIMASPNRRGRITINNDDTNIDDSFRKNANHSFVETNYSKGKTIRRSYSSSNLYNNNCVNVFNLLVNNVNNINNNNILVSNNSNNKSKQNQPQLSKQNEPSNYINTNKSKIPFDKKINNNNIPNNNNYYYVSSYSNRTYNQKIKNNSFSKVDDRKTLSSGLKNNDYGNNSFRYSSNYSYKNINNNNNINNIMNIESVEKDRKTYLIPDKYKNMKRNHSYSSIRYFKNDIPQNSINKIIPLKSNDKAISYKNGEIPINIFSNKNTNENLNKIKTIEYINKNKESNSFIYIDKYKKNNEINPKLNDVQTLALDNSKHSNFSHSKVGLNSNINFIEERNSNKRAPPPIILGSNYQNNISKKNNNNNLLLNNNNVIKLKENNINNIINIPKPQQFIEKNSSHKKIPIPFPLNQKIVRKKLVLDKNPDITLNFKINQSNKTLNNLPLKNDFNDSYYQINNKENIKLNVGNKYSETIDLNKYDNQISLNNDKKPLKNFETISLKMNSSLIPKKIIEKNFYRYQYLKNFDKYKKIRNNRDKNKNPKHNKKFVPLNNID